uniref:protein-tyrosine-phosphatase n=1 Tax=Lotharella oceanica TaxID=641309 RepID=A0A7S2THQ3_9EUKA
MAAQGVPLPTGIPMPTGVPMTNAADFIVSNMMTPDIPDEKTLTAINVKSFLEQINLGQYWEILHRNGCDFVADLAISKPSLLVSVAGMDAGDAERTIQASRQILPPEIYAETSNPADGGETGNGEMTQILPNLYIGTIDAAAKVILGIGEYADLKITHVLDTSDDIHTYSPDPVYHKAKVMKLNLCDYGSTELYKDGWKILTGALNFIKEALSLKDGKILVSCVAGVSRSATIIIAWLMQSRRLTLENALLEVRAKRSKIFPEAYLWQLAMFESKLREIGHLPQSAVPTPLTDADDYLINEVRKHTAIFSKFSQNGEGSSGSNEQAEIQKHLAAARANANLQPGETQAEHEAKKRLNFKNVLANPSCRFCASQGKPNLAKRKKILNVENCYCHLKSVDVIHCEGCQSMYLSPDGGYRRADLDANKQMVYMMDKFVVAE